MKKFLAKTIVTILLFAYPVNNALNLAARDSKSVPVSTVQPSADIAVLEALESENAAEIEKKIDKLNKENEEAIRLEQLKKQRADSIEALKKQISEGKTSYRQILNGTVIAGDSLMHGMYEYNVLDKSRLVTKVSASLPHLNDNLSKIISLNPKVLVLHYGHNNMSTNDSTINNFVSSYEKTLLKLQKSLPDTRIVVSSVFNVSDRKAQGSLADVPKFNKALKEMCKKNGFEYLDNSELLSGESEYYEPDGMHVTKKFYTEKYLPNLVIALGL